MENQITNILFLVVILLLGGVSVVWSFKRSARMVESWAKQNRYKLVESRCAIFAKGPFFWSTSKNQMVYRVVVCDTEGRTRSGWVRCGTWLGGLLSDKTEVRWDGEY